MSTTFPEPKYQVGAASSRRLPFGICLRIVLALDEFGDAVAHPPRKRVYVVDGELTDDLLP